MIEELGEEGYQEYIRKRREEFIARERVSCSHRTTEKNEGKKTF